VNKRVQDMLAKGMNRPEATVNAILDCAIDAAKAGHDLTGDVSGFNEALVILREHVEAEIKARIDAALALRNASQGQVPS
jgi:hypothetical protein